MKGDPNIPDLLFPVPDPNYVAPIPVGPVERPASMSVRALINALQDGCVEGKWSLDSEVKTEGCDCDGDARSVEPYLDYEGVAPKVYIRR